MGQPVQEPAATDATQSAPPSAHDFRTRSRSRSGSVESRVSQMSQESQACHGRGTGKTGKDKDKKDKQDLKLSEAEEELMITFWSKMSASGTRSVWATGRRTYDKYRACAPRVSGVGPALPAHVRRDSSVYIHVSNSVHNFVHAQKSRRTKRMARNEKRWFSALYERITN